MKVGGLEKKEGGRKFRESKEGAGVEEWRNEGRREEMKVGGLEKRMEGEKSGRGGGGEWRNEGRKE